MSIIWRIYSVAALMSVCFASFVGIEETINASIIAVPALIALGTIEICEAIRSTK